MKLTPNYSLKKPDLTDVADIEVLNGNMDIIDSQFKNFSTLLDNKITIIPPIQAPFTSDTKVICSKSCTNVVCLNITVKNHSSAPIWGSLFAILPIGFRPSEYTSAIAIYNINGNFSVSHISLNENGELKASIPYGNGIGSCSFSFIAKK